MGGDNDSGLVGGLRYMYAVFAFLQFYTAYSVPLCVRTMLNPECTSHFHISCLATSLGHVILWSPPPSSTV